VLFPRGEPSHLPGEREFFIDNLLVRIHFIIVMFRWTGLAPWEFEFAFPGSLTSTFLVERGRGPDAPREGGPAPPRPEDGGVERPLAAPPPRDAHLRLGRGVCQ